MRTGLCFRLQIFDSVITHAHTHPHECPLPQECTDDPDCRQMQYDFSINRCTLRSDQCQTRTEAPDRHIYTYDKGERAWGASMRACRSIPGDTVCVGG